MTGLRHPSTRLAWGWCVAYTAPVPAHRRERRRDEILSHLWESERAQLRPRSILSATARGALQDLTWAAKSGGRTVLTAPGMWLTLSVAFTVGGLVASTVADRPSAGVGEQIGLIGSLALLAVSGLLWWRKRS